MNDAVNVFDPSDFALMACLVAAVDFSGAFALGRPRVWPRDPLGWVIFLYSLAVVALLVLIVYGIVFGQKVDEPYRFAIAVFLLGSLIAKRWILHRERVKGRRANERPAIERIGS